jgi:hypothetical protein
MSLLWQVSYFLKGVGRDVQCRFEGAVMDLNHFARPAQGTRGGATCDDVPDLRSSMARFERMLRLLEEKKPWPDDSGHLEDDESFDHWRDWPMPIRGCRIASSAAL